MEHLSAIILLLVVTIIVVVTFQRLRIPTSLGYLLVGVILGPHTIIGYAVSIPELNDLAAFGVVFLLFAIGLNYSIPQLAALRHQVLGLGTGQVFFTTAIVSFIFWCIGVPATAAFVFGAAFSQSSTTIIANLLAEQNEENTQHGRLGLAISVFQDVTAVPFLIIIPALGATIVADVMLSTLGWALAKAIVAFLIVFIVGRLLCRPLFHLISEYRSMEIFTLAVLMVALLSAWTTNSFGLSLAFGGFLAGMMLGETEFRHQVESCIRPFRDVLLGLFFIGIGMRFEPDLLSNIWLQSLLGALLIIFSKIAIVVMMLHRQTIKLEISLRTALLLSVGGEFGLALVAIALDFNVLDVKLGQIAITSVLISMVIGAILIRFNGGITGLIYRDKPLQPFDSSDNIPANKLPYQVVIGGYGRVGHTISVLLQSTGVPFIVFDTDSKRVMHGRNTGNHPVFYGDISDPELLTSIHVERASLVVITVNDTEVALKALTYLSRTCPQVPVIARTRDLETSTQLLEAGAVQAYPEIIEASLQLGETTLNMLDIPQEKIQKIVQNVRDNGYKPVQEE